MWLFLTSVNICHWPLQTSVQTFRFLSFQLWYCSKCVHGNRKHVVEVWVKTSDRLVLYFKVLSYFPQWSNISCRESHRPQLSTRPEVFRDHSVWAAPDQTDQCVKSSWSIPSLRNSSAHCCSVNVPSSVSSVRETAGGFFILRLRLKTWLSVRHRVYMEVNSAGNQTPPAAAAGTTGLWWKDTTHLLILRASPSRWRTLRAPCVKFYVQQRKKK